MHAHVHEDADHHEMRSDPRITLKIEIGVHRPTNFYTGITMNISTGGLFIATHVPARIGEIIPLSFILPEEGGYEVRVTGEVCWWRSYRHEFPDAHPGMGLKFLDLSPADAERINHYLHTVREPYFHPGEE